MRPARVEGKKKKKKDGGKRKEEEENEREKKRIENSVNTYMSVFLEKWAHCQMTRGFTFNPGY